MRKIRTAVIRLHDVIRTRDEMCLMHIRETLQRRQRTLILQDRHFHPSFPVSSLLVNSSWEENSHEEAQGLLFRYPHNRHIMPLLLAVLKLRTATTGDERLPCRAHRNDLGLLVSHFRLLS